jgi:mannose-1-phosphate guanylyltransferase
MVENYYAVIMAGGGGTRLWPLSRKSQPKQMLSLVDDRSLFQSAVDRLQNVFRSNQIYVVTVAEQANLLQEQAPEIPAENFLIEPLPRGTASVVGLAAIAILRRDPDACMAVVTADHIIGNPEKFDSLLLSAYEVAQDGFLVTLGITPTAPSTGYGYIQQGQELGEYLGEQVYTVKKFKEKPSFELAQSMILGGDHTWNSGMFIWRVETIMQEIEQQMPALNTKLNEITQMWKEFEDSDIVECVWPTIQPQTIDYGIMEGAEKVAVIPAVGLDWSDVGSWDALYGLLPEDPDGNIVKGGQHISVDSISNLIYSGQDRLFVTIGVDNLILVDTGDVVLVCHKEQAQKVRQVVDTLKQEGKTDYL